METCNRGTCLALNKNCRRHDTFNWVVADLLECRLGGRDPGWIRVLCSDVWPGITFYWTLITVPCFRWNSVTFLCACVCDLLSIPPSVGYIHPTEWNSIWLMFICWTIFYKSLCITGIQNSDVPSWWGLEWKDRWIQENQSWPQEQSFKTQGWQWSSKASGL